MLEKALFSGVAKESASHNIQPGVLKESQSPDKRVVGQVTRFSCEAFISWNINVYMSIIQVVNDSSAIDP